MELTRYINTLQSFDRLVAHTRAQADVLAGKVLDQHHMNYTDPIFGKLICHAISLRKLMPEPSPPAGETIWDLASCCAIGRALIETFDALAYVSLNPVNQSEREFRVRLWELHDVERRLKMLGFIGSTDPQVTTMKADAAHLHTTVTSHVFFARISPGVRSKVLNFDSPAFHLSHSERCVVNGVDHAYYTAATMHLSQFVHTFPMSVHQLAQFRAGEPDALRLMSMPLQYSMTFVAKAIEGIRSTFPQLAIAANEPTEKDLRIWVGLGASGVKGLI